jgi:hypothetical protein
LDLSALACSVQDSWAALMATWSASRKRMALTELRRWHALVGDWIRAFEEDLSHAPHVNENTDRYSAGDQAGAEAWRERDRGNSD